MCLLRLRQHVLECLMKRPTLSGPCASLSLSVLACPEGGVCLLWSQPERAWMSYEEARSVLPLSSSSRASPVPTSTCTRCGTSGSGSPSLTPTTSR